MTRRPAFALPASGPHQSAALTDKDSKGRPDILVRSSPPVAASWLMSTATPN
jgi:hypothetical protein